MKNTPMSRLPCCRKLSWILVFICASVCCLNPIRFKRKQNGRNWILFPVAIELKIYCTLFLKRDDCRKNSLCWEGFGNFVIYVANPIVAPLSLQNGHIISEQSFLQGWAVLSGNTRCFWFFSWGQICIRSFLVELWMGYFEMWKFIFLERHTILLSLYMQAQFGVADY